MLHTSNGTLPATPPFDFGQSLRFLGGFEPMGGEHRIADGALTKGLWVGEGPIAFRVTASGSDEQPGLDYTLFAERALAAGERAAAEGAIAAFLGLADDLRPFYAVGERDEYFAPVLARLRGYHQVRFRSPFENACWAVLTQRIPIPQAQLAKRNIVELFDATITVEGIAYPSFPPAERLATIDHDALRATVGHERRTEYLLAVAEAFAGVDDSWLRAAPWDEVYDWLRAIKGIGPWSASFVMLRGIGRMERLPVGEGRLAEVVARVYNGGRTVTEEGIAALAEPYGDYRGYWAHYLRAAG